MTQTYRERCEFMPRILKGLAGKPGDLTDEEKGQILARQVNRLIQWLYRPHPELGWVRGRSSADGYPFDRDLINWGDLGVVDVKWTTTGTAIITIEEAAEGDAPNLCRWLEDWLALWGWDTEVRTEW